MKYVITIGLTLILSCSIIIIVGKRNKSIFNKKIYRQSDMHNMLKNFFSLDTDNKISSSQIQKRKEEQTTNVVILKDKAYWVKDNVFYVGSTTNGEVLPETGVPIDTNTLSELEINKLLFILDNLKGGKTNDSSSAGD